MLRKIYDVKGTVRVEDPDISYWQGRPYPEYKTSGINWDVFFAKTSRFIARLGIGFDEDVRWDEYYAKAQEYGADVGAYWYWIADFSPSYQAEVVIERLQDVKALPLGFWIDVEDWANLTQAKYFARLKTFYNEIKKARPDLTIGIYTRGEFWNRMVGEYGRDWIKDKPLWIARYSSVATDPWADNPNVLKPIGAETWERWQYTETGNGADYGVRSASIDLNKTQLFVMPDPEIVPVYPAPKLKVVVATRLTIRAEPSSGSAVLGYLYNGTEIDILEIKPINTSQIWVRHPKGWSALLYGTNLFME